MRIGDPRGVRTSSNLSPGFTTLGSFGPGASPPPPSPPPRPTRHLLRPGPFNVQCHLHVLRGPRARVICGSVPFRSAGAGNSVGDGLAVLQKLAEYGMGPPRLLQSYAWYPVMAAARAEGDQQPNADAVVLLHRPLTAKGRVFQSDSGDSASTLTAHCSLPGNTASYYEALRQKDFPVSGPAGLCCRLPFVTLRQWPFIAFPRSPSRSARVRLVLLQGMFLPLPTSGLHDALMNGMSNRLLSDGTQVLLLQQQPHSCPLRTPVLQLTDRRTAAAAAAAGPAL